MALSGIAGRPTADALFVEIGPVEEFDRFSSSKIVVFPADEERDYVEAAVRKYGLEKIGRTQAFVLYKNPNCTLTARVRQASVPFSVIGLVILCLAVILLKNRHKIYLT
jgi:hypothetical protein